MISVREKSEGFDLLGFLDFIYLFIYSHMTSYLKRTNKRVCVFASETFRALGHCAVNPIPSY
jgi:hypothetical protein